MASYLFCMAVYGVKPTRERPTDDARERRFVAEGTCITW